MAKENEELEGKICGTCQLRCSQERFENFICLQNVKSCASTPRIFQILEMELEFSEQEDQVKQIEGLEAEKDSLIAANESEKLISANLK